MKNSTRILLFSALGMWALRGLGLVALSRFVAGGDLPLRERGGSDSTVTIAPSLDQFSEVDLRGSWTARIRYSDRCTVSVTVPAAFDERVEVSREGRRLVCRSPEVHDEGSRMEVRIGMPDLESLHTEGLCTVELRDMALDSLRVRTRGMTTIGSRGLAVTALDYQGEGMGQLTITDEGVTHARIRARGMGSVRLHMLGGSLAGRLEGMVRLHYTGEITSNTLTVDGAATSIHG